MGTCISTVLLLVGYCISEIFHNFKIFKKEPRSLTISLNS